jgi:hypothetical protein
MEDQKVILENGTVLEVGKKYRQKYFLQGEYIEIKAFDGDVMLVRNYCEVPFIQTIKKDWLPYEKKIPKEDFKMFLIEVEHVKRKIVYQFPILTDSIESAQKLHPKAKSITEVNLPTWIALKK